MEPLSQVLKLKAPNHVATKEEHTASIHLNVDSVKIPSLLLKRHLHVWDNCNLEETSSVGFSLGDIHYYVDPCGWRMSSCTAHRCKYHSDTALSIDHRKGVHHQGTNWQKEGLRLEVVQYAWLFEPLHLKQIYSWLMGCIFQPRYPSPLKVVEHKDYPAFWRLPVPTAVLNTPSKLSVADLWWLVVFK